jgi:glycosyltransferase involved in cell wall biosynthesis
MKILIVNTLDIEGGAARAAYRLHRALLAKGIASQMLVQRKSSDDFTVICPETKIQKGLGRIRPMLDALPVYRYKNSIKTLFSPSWLPFSNMVNNINTLKPDLVHLHWVAGGMMRIEDITRIKAPIVWSLHDNWVFTGGCHIMWGCTRYQQACGNCPILRSGKDNDLSRKVFIRKERMFDKLDNVTIVSLSYWLYKCAIKSPLLSKYTHVCLPNPIDTKIFSPVDRRVARELLNLPQEKKMILFGAMSATSDINKGHKELTKALLSVNTDVELVVFGSSKPQMSQDFTYKTHYLGRLYDDVTLKVLYSAADVMVVPSLQEAFGQTATEAMACGTPVVAFATTGLLDIVDHQINGYLAKPFDTNDLANGIDWVLNAKNYEQLCENAREKVMNTFDSRLVAKQYIDLYQNIIDGRKKSICSENI